MYASKSAIKCVAMLPGRPGHCFLPKNAKMYMYEIRRRSPLLCRNGRPLSRSLCLSLFSCSRAVDASFWSPVIHCHTQTAKYACTRHVLLSQLKAHMLHELTARVVFASDSSVSAFGLFRGCHPLSLSTSLGLAAAASAEAGLQAVDEVADDC